MSFADVKRTIEHYSTTSFARAWAHQLPRCITGALWISSRTFAALFDYRINWTTGISNKLNSPPNVIWSIELIFGSVGFIMFVHVMTNILSPKKNKQTKVMYNWRSCIFMIWWDLIEERKFIRINEKPNAKHLETTLHHKTEWILRNGLDLLDA